MKTHRARVSRSSRSVETNKCDRRQFSEALGLAAIGSVMNQIDTIERRLMEGCVVAEVIGRLYLLRFDLDSLFDSLKPNVAARRGCKSRRRTVRKNA